MSPDKRTRRERAADVIPTIAVILALLVAPLVIFVTITVIATGIWLFVVVPLCLVGTIVFSILGAVLFLTNMYLEESPEQQQLRSGSTDKGARGMKREAKQMEENGGDESKEDVDKVWETDGDEDEEK